MKTIKTQVSENLEVVIIPNQDHEFLMTTQEVALAYGITPGTLRRHKQNHSDNLNEGRHFVKGITIMHTLGKNAQPHQTFWTKRGIVRFSFFIKSERAKLFRDWVEDLVIEQLEGNNTKQVLRELPETPKRKHNRLTVERINDIIHRSLRMIIAEKLKP